MVALVGPSGGGKSTLCDLLLRLYNPSFGSIKIDGVDIKTYSKKSYLEKCGVVPQESLLLNASIKENILYGRPFDLEKFERSIRIANAIDFIADLPEKENTTVGDRGIRLSGGQKQRISIARAVYDNPEILILDEATSALDNESEKVVQDAIDKAIKSMTAIVVAHRLSTIRHASKIIVIDNGKVEAIGDHQKLMEISSVYRRLNSIHFSETEQTKNFRKDNQCLLI
jgi:ABC-type multidrug transport system fused ATPase/permease subunit